MMQNLNANLYKNRRFLPVAATIVLFVIAYALGAFFYTGMREVHTFLTLFITSPFLLLSAIGETFVIISGGIDLSVSGMIALTSTASAALLRAGWNPWVVMPLMVAMGAVIGTILGVLITYMKVQPFIATLAGMWFTRGICYIISDAEIRIYDPVYKLLSGTKLLIPGLSDPVTKKGDYVTILVVFSLIIFAIAIYIAHYTKFGRTVYSIGGNNGANEQSARLMGLPVDRTKVLVYTFSGVCSALAGIVYSIYVGSGHGSHASNGYEMIVIASVVIGGTVLTGGVGYVFGSLFGVLVTGLIQTLIQFNGTLSSWWASIAIGALTLVFIGIQSLLVNLNTGKSGGLKSPATVEARRRQLLSFGIGAVVVVVLALLVVPFIQNAINKSAETSTSISTRCQRQPFRPDQAASLIKDGAVIAYERNGGQKCVDELYAIYPDGRITGDNGTQKIEKQVTTAEVDKLLLDIDNYGWFTDNMYTTSHNPCEACYTYFTTVSYKGQQKTVEAVDGGTDAPPEYFYITGDFTVLIPGFAPAP